jgi:hypothetical protein
MTVVERNDWRGGLLAWDQSTRTVWSNTNLEIQQLRGFRTGDPLRTLPHAQVRDLFVVDPTTIWVHEHGAVTRYERSWPDIELHLAGQLVNPEPIVDVYPTPETGWLVVGSRVLRWDAS